jgi:hypothetical protein
MFRKKAQVPKLLAEFSVLFRPRFTRSGALYIWVRL